MVFMDDYNMNLNEQPIGSQDLKFSEFKERLLRPSQWQKDFRIHLRGTSNLAWYTCTILPNGKLAAFVSDAKAATEINESEIDDYYYVDLGYLVGGLLLRKHYRRIREEARFEFCLFRNFIIRNPKAERDVERFFDFIGYDNVDVVREMVLRNRRLLHSTTEIGGLTNGLLPAPGQLNPLQFAAACRSNGCLKFLLTQGLDVNGPPDSNRPPLYWAIMEDNPERQLETLRILVEAGADLDRSLGSETAFFLTVSCDQCELAKLLLESGASMHFEDFRSQTLLFNIESLEMLKILDPYHPNYNIQDRDGNTPLHCFVERIENRQDTSEAIYQVAMEVVRRGASLYTRNHENLSPLDRVKSFSNQQLFQDLIEAAEQD